VFIFDFFSRWILDILFFSGYIYNNNVFPPPLSSDEEKKLIEMMSSGDINARKKLIEHNIRLVAHIAKKYGEEKNLEDYISIGTVGLIKGIDTYNPEKNIKLSPYISRCIENEILMVLRSNKKRQNDVSIDDSIGIDKDGNALTLADVLPADNLDIADEIWNKIETEKLYLAIKNVLTSNEKLILYYRYGLNGQKRKTQREIANELGISRSYVSRIEKKCLKKLFKEINKISLSE